VAACAVLEVMEKENLISRAAALGEYVMRHLRNTAVIREVRGRGLMIGVELLPEHAALRAEMVSAHKIFTGSAGANVIRLLPPLTVTEQELQRFVEVLGAACNSKTELNCRQSVDS
jgi:acetylornithine aminotransferase